MYIRRAMKSIYLVKVHDFQFHQKIPNSAQTNYEVCHGGFMYQ